MSEHAAREKRGSKRQDRTTHREVELCLQNPHRLDLDGLEQAVGSFALKLIPTSGDRREIDVVPLQERPEIIECLRKVENGVYE